MSLQLRKDHDCLQTHVENAKQVEQGRDSDFLTVSRIFHASWIQGGLTQPDDSDPPGD